MNGFIKEVCTQGEKLKKAIGFYRQDGKKLIEEIADQFQKRGLQKVILTGMGSSLYAMDVAKSYLTESGIPTLTFSSFELSRFQFGQIDNRTLVVAVSQSGNSQEVIELVEKAKKVTLVVGIYNNQGSKLSEISDISLPLCADKEHSITSKTYENTMLIMNIIANRLTGTLNNLFWDEVSKVIEWIDSWLEKWEENARPMAAFAEGIELFDLLANDTSLATARQLSLAYREGLHNCTAVWECADYAHGQYHSSKMAEKYLAQMFFPVLEDGTKEMKMFHFILDHGGKVMLYTTSEIKSGDQVYIVKLPSFRKSFMPLIESIAAETMLGILFGPDWVKDH